MALPKVFIDGEAGTTGLEIRKRLEHRKDLTLLTIPGDKRKDPKVRYELLNSTDLAILCLPDEASREAVAMIENASTKVLDASSAFRTEPSWVYGFPELTQDQEVLIREARRVSNPGCYPTGAVALIRPLVVNGILSSHAGLTVSAISGYSGGGKELIALCEGPDKTGRAAPFCLYGIDQRHKHLPEIKTHSTLSVTPIFLPSYSSAFYRGMLITIALRLDEMTASAKRPIAPMDIFETFSSWYKDRKHVAVKPLQTNLDKGYVLNPLTQNGTNNLELRVFGNDGAGTVILTACLDNLGKGASGAAVQNMELMLGLAPNNPTL